MSLWWQAFRAGDQPSGIAGDCPGFGTEKLASWEIPESCVNWDSGAGCPPISGPTLRMKPVSVPAAAPTARGIDAARGQGAGWTSHPTTAGPETDWPNQMFRLPRDLTVAQSPFARSQRRPQSRAEPTVRPALPRCRPLAGPSLSLGR